MTEPVETRPDWKELLADRWWRLNHLYWIEDKDGQMVRFRDVYKRQLLRYQVRSNGQASGVQLRGHHGIGREAGAHAGHCSG